MDESLVDTLRHTIEKHLRGPLCASRGMPPTDGLMRQWVNGVLSRDPEARNKLRCAIEFSRAKVAEADAAAPLSGPAQDARSCYAKRVEILEAIERAVTHG